MVLFAWCGFWVFCAFPQKAPRLCRPQGSSCRPQCTRRRCTREDSRSEKKLVSRLRPDSYGKTNTVKHHRIRHASRSFLLFRCWHSAVKVGHYYIEYRFYYHLNELSLAIDPADCDSGLVSLVNICLTATTSREACPI